MLLIESTMLNLNNLLLAIKDDNVVIVIMATQIIIVINVNFHVVLGTSFL